MAADYKTLKEAFVSDQTGSSIWHVNLVSSIALASIALHHTLDVRSSNPDNTTFLQGWLVLVLPLLLSQTLFATHPLFLSALVLISMAGVVFFVPAKRKIPLPSNLDVPRRSPSPSPMKNPYLTPPISVSSSPVIAGPHSGLDELTATANAQRSPLSIPVDPLPALSTYRAHMLLMTAVAILAVDFPVFPRMLAKCETFGVSLMDIGVGSFVFAQGVISTIPVLKGPTRLSEPILGKILQTAKKVAPVLLIGVVRVVLVKGTEYPEHVSEYGAHWNFFVTLALLPILEAFLHPLIAHVSVIFLGCAVAVVHQALLSTTGLQTYVLTAPRTNVIAANKEGVASVTGYLAIHLLGFALGTVILPPSPSDFSRRQELIQKTPASSLDKLHLRKSLRKDDRTAIELVSYAMLYWCLLLLVHNPFFGVSGGVSRRLVNLPYILWVAAYNSSFICGYFLLDMLFYPAEPASKYNPRPPRPSTLHPPSSSHTNAIPEDDPPRTAPALLEAINTNGLLFFLLANVLTGLTNLTIETMFASDTFAMLVLILYSIAVCGVAWVFRERRMIRL